MKKLLKQVHQLQCRPERTWNLKTEQLKSDIPLGKHLNVAVPCSPYSLTPTWKYSSYSMVAPSQHESLDCQRTCRDKVTLCKDSRLKRTFCVSQASMTWIGEIVRDEVKTFNFMARTNTLLSPYYCIEAVFNHISPRENPRHPTSPHLCCEAFHWTKQSRRRVAGVAIAVAGWGVFPGVQMRLTLGNEALLSAKTFRSIISDYSHQQASNVTSHGPLGLSQPRSLIWMRWIEVETTFFIRLFWLYTPQDHRMHCMVYLSTFTIEIQQMWANIPYIDHIGATCWVYRGGLPGILTFFGVGWGGVGDDTVPCNCTHLGATQLMFLSCTCTHLDATQLMFLALAHISMLRNWCSLHLHTSRCYATDVSCTCTHLDATQLMFLALAHISCATQLMFLCTCTHLDATQLMFLARAQIWVLRKWCSLHLHTSRRYATDVSLHLHTSRCYATDVSCTCTNLGATQMMFLALAHISALRNWCSLQLHTSRC